MPEALDKNNIDDGHWVIGSTSLGPRHWVNARSYTSHMEEAAGRSQVFAGEMPHTRDPPPDTSDHQNQVMIKEAMENPLTLSPRSSDDQPNSMGFRSSKSSDDQGGGGEPAYPLSEIK
jgi:hypothetical protein